jgi:hypothetical protein
MTNHKSQVRCVVGIRLATRFFSLARARYKRRQDLPGLAGFNQRRREDTS